MRVIPVIDLMGGHVVRGVAGRRSEYRPIESRMAPDARPATVARAFVDQFGFDTAYVADLDAIGGSDADLSSLDAIAAAGLGLWIDAGIAKPFGYRLLHERLRSRGIEARLVIGLESLDDPDDEQWQPVFSLNPIFSLDMKDGVPIHHVRAWHGQTAQSIAHRAHARGWFTIIVLDLADVGTTGGTRTLDLCRQLKIELNPLSMIAGGGVRGIDDLKALADAGCDAALVASALHDGRLSPAEVRQLAGLTN